MLEATFVCNHGQLNSLSLVKPSAGRMPFDKRLGNRRDPIPLHTRLIAGHFKKFFANRVTTNHKSIQSAGIFKNLT